MNSYPFGDGRVLVELKNGLHLAVPVNDPFMGAQIVIDRCWEPFIERKIVENLRPGARAVNVGASVGYFAALMGRIIGREGRLFCFEPNPAVFDLLIYNLLVNKVHERANVYRQAVAHKAVDLELLFSDRYLDGWLVSDRQVGGQFSENGQFIWNDMLARDPQARTIPSRTVTLNHMLGDAGAFDFLLVDAEGYDIGILHAADRLIGNSPNLRILFEWHRAFTLSIFPLPIVERLFDLLAKAGFRFEFADSLAADPEWMPADDPMDMVRRHSLGNFFAWRQ